MFEEGKDKERIISPILTEEESATVEGWCSPEFPTGCVFTEDLADDESLAAAARQHAGPIAADKHKN